MKKHIITIVLGVAFGLSGYSQNDTIFFSKEDFNAQIQQIKQEINDNASKKYDAINSKTNSVRTVLLDSLEKQSLRIQQLETLLEVNKQEVSNNKSELNSTKENLNSVKTDAETKISTLDESLNSKTLISYLLIILSAALAIILFFFLRRRMTSDNTKLDNQISSTRSALQDEHMKLDQKLIEMYESQLQVQKEERKTTPAKEEEVDHTLATKVADEIVRMQKNISNMPDDTKGLKQLTKALQRIQDTFKVNGYEMLEMLGKPYNDGMNMVANFIPDESLEPGQQIITRIIKPQVNFNGVMIQSAQVEVSISE